MATAGVGAGTSGETDGVVTTHTRTHVFISFANPYLVCDQCRGSVIGWHDNDKCGCDGTFWNTPCGCVAGATSKCPSWGPVDGCTCRESS